MSGCISQCMIVDSRHQVSLCSDDLVGVLVIQSSLHATQQLWDGGQSRDMFLQKLRTDVNNESDGVPVAPLYCLVAVQCQHAIG